MKNKNSLLITTLILCLACALASCATNSDDASSTDDIGSTPENSVIDTASEDSSAEESSEIPAETSDESSDEASEPVEESSEEVSEDDPYYVTEMTDEMVVAFWEYVTGEPVPDESSSDKVSSDRKYYYDPEYIAARYYAYGNLNGYTLFNAMVFNNNYTTYKQTSYQAGEYLFTSPTYGQKSKVFLYLYKDGEFITFEEAYEEGIVNAKKAYELINSADETELIKSALPIKAEKKLLSTAQLDYVAEMTDEMAREFFGEFQNENAARYERYIMYIKNEYHAYGNLNGYTLCYTIHPYGTSDFTKGKYSVDGYTFQCYSDVGLSRVCLYLYRDNEFITFEDGYKRGLFDLEDAYELIKNNPYQKPITGTVEYPPIKYVTVHTVEKAEIPQQNYVTEMTDKMAGEFFDPEVFVGVTQSVLATAKDYYHAYGNLNGYTLCYVANRMCASNFLEKKYTAGDYIFYNKLPSYPSEISLYLYRDNTFVPFEAAYEQGIFDPKDAYELIIGNPSTADPGASCIRAEKAKESSGENSEPDYVTEMTDEMADLFLTSVYKYQIPELRISLGNNDFKEYLLEQYLVKYTYYAYGNLNGYTLFTAYGMETNDMAIAKYRAGDYIFEAPCHGTASFVFLYLYRDNEIITFEDAYERGLFDPKDAYELMVNNPPSGEIVKTIRVHAEKAED